MKWNRKLRGVRFAMLGLAALAACGWIVTALWNWLMPEIFGLHSIGFWQALGLLIMARILFGGLRGGPGHGFRGRRMMMRRWAERWEKMTPREREEFREAMRHSCGQFGPTATEPGLQK